MRELGIVRDDRRRMYAAPLLLLFSFSPRQYGSRPSCHDPRVACAVWSSDTDCPTNATVCVLLFHAVWIVFIMLSSLVMLNLVVGVVCSAMTEATENHSKGAEKEDCLVEIVNETGTPRKIVDRWVEVRLYPLLPSCPPRAARTPSSHLYGSHERSIVLNAMLTHTGLRAPG